MQPLLWLNGQKIQRFFGMFNRKTLRIPKYSYKSHGHYFVTFCTQNRLALFGNIINGEMNLNDAGRMVHMKIANTPHYYLDVHIDTFIVMPDHVHALVVLDGVGRTQRLKYPHIFLRNFFKNQ